MSFGLYSAGFAIVIAGLIYGAHLMHVPTHWIVVAQSCCWGSESYLVSKPHVRKILRSSCWFHPLCGWASNNDQLSPARSQDTLHQQGNFPTLSSTFSRHE